MRLKEIKPGMVIHCKTEEEANALMVELNRLGYTWDSHIKPTHHTNWKTYREETCYRLEDDTFAYADRGFYASKYEITEFSDLIIPELSAKEVLEILQEVCVGKGCKECIFVEGCPFSAKGGDIDKTIEICTKWREKHPKEEKKELETEWVDVVRIIKVHDNGKKECVHEVEAYVCSEDVYLPFSENEAAAERELKDYVANHDGNFFATLEHICCIKE